MIQIEYVKLRTTSFNESRIKLKYPEKYFIGPDGFYVSRWYKDWKECTHQMASSYSCGYEICWNCYECNSVFIEEPKPFQSPLRRIVDKDSSIEPKWCKKFLHRMTPDNTLRPNNCKQCYKQRQSRYRAISQEKY